MILTYQCYLTMLPILLYHLSYFKLKSGSSRELNAFKIVGSPGGVEFRRLPLYHLFESHSTLALTQISGICSC